MIRDKSQSIKYENRQFLLLVFSGWISVGLCHAVRYAVRQIALRDPLDNMPATIVSSIFAFLAVAFALFFVLKATRLCVRGSTADCPRKLVWMRWLGLVAVWVPAVFYVLLWIYAWTWWGWLEWTARF